MRKLTAVLFTAPNRECVRSDLPEMHSGGDIGIKPPLGLLHVASHAACKTIHSMNVVDAAVGDLDYDALVERICSLSPDVVGVTAWTDYWYPTVKTLELLKKRMPSLCTVVGGPHTLVYPRETLEQGCVDAVIVGDGETPFAAFLDCIADDNIRNDIPGLHFKRFGIHFNLVCEEPDLNALAHPARDLLPVDKYYSVVGKGRLSSTMITSRGCPFSCVYCKMIAQKPRMHSPDYVLEEFDRIHALGIREVEVYDDTFTWSHERVEEICRGLIRRNYDIQWAVRDRVSNVRRETLELMKRAGCTRIHYGIESGCNEVLERIKKRITTEDARESVAMAKKIGFEVLVFFMLGLPGETMEEAGRTVEFSLKLPADYSLYSIATAYPGTEMYVQALADHRIEYDYWHEFALRPVPNFIPPDFQLSRMSGTELLALRNEAIRRFYFRPRTLANELLKLRSPKEFLRKAKMGLMLARGLFTGRG